MSNIIKIFQRDVRGLFTNVFALIVAIGLTLLPALYAWFNIFSNWNPYGNTANIQIAVVNLDEGWTDENGNTTNMGDDIVESLKEKTSIGWVFMDSEETAVEGIENGTYYAAIVLDPKFTYGMYNGVYQGVESPKLTYYVNGKKNAVATKITDAAVSNVTTSVNEAFIKALATRMFEEINGISWNEDNTDAATAVIESLKDVTKKLESYDDMITDFKTANEAMSKVMANASGDMTEASGNIEQGAANLGEAQEGLSSTQASFNQFSGNVNSTMSTIKNSLDTINTEITNAKLDTDVATLQTDIQTIQKDASDLLTAYTNLETVVTTLYKQQGKQVPTWFSKSIQAAQVASGVINSMGSGVNAGELTETAIGMMQNQLTNASYSIEELRLMYTNEMVPNINNMLDSMESVLLSAQKLMVNLASATNHLGGVMVELSGTFDAINTSMTEVQTVIRKFAGELNAALDLITAVTGDEQLEMLKNFLSSDPETIGEFFAEPVQVEDHYIYEISNYGSGVSPFYTTLAIWVGMTILVSLVKVHADHKDLTDVKPHQLFFGRYLIFFILSQVQAAIIVLGDLFILKIQCVSPFYFWLAAAMTSFTFSLLVYSLTISFGDVGKAFAVVIMVLQIAGSGGTFPIEALPTFFQKVYIFFPFPYAIDAMRECIGGFYQSKYMTCMLQLGLFCIAALVVGLWIRLPFIKVNHFFEKRMEDTEIL